MQDSRLSSNAQRTQYRLQVLAAMTLPIFAIVFWFCTFVESGLLRSQIVPLFHGSHQPRVTSSSEISNLDAQVAHAPSLVSAVPNNDAAISLYQHALPIETHPLVALLPVSQFSLPDLEQVILTFANHSDLLQELIVCCSESIYADTRQILKGMWKHKEAERLPELSLRLWSGNDNPSEGILRIASQISATEWILVLDEYGLQNLPDHARNALLKPLSIPFPVGPRGVVVTPRNTWCIAPSERPQASSYLIPPFVLPSSSLVGLVIFPNTWELLGERVSSSRPDGLGGIVYALSPDTQQLPNSSLQQEYSDNERRQDNSKDLQSPSMGVFVLLLPSNADLEAFSPSTLTLHENGHNIRVLIYQENSNHSVQTPYTHGSLNIDMLTSTIPSDLVNIRLIFQWLRNLEHLPDIILTLAEEKVLNAALTSYLVTNLPHATVISIPRLDLPYTLWMTALSLEEWKNWNIPRIDISVITKDRPQSLARLLSSLSKGRLFGDSLDLRVNVEQPSNLATLQLVEDFRWNHGSMCVHHRVVHGGLLPAVVESWYPQSNDHYGLLLEDDVELSPLFYAWIKMNVLRYRYGLENSHSQKLFGISLYQQKNIELKPEGRQPFDAKSLFLENDIPPTMPYLSQIPCSWGAVYFPEHWREFHSFLPLRLAQQKLGIDRVIVPNVRSNRWTKSWKKYFIELVYLQGYVMIYPNFADFVSLSTNHLEVGSHVKIRSREKEDMFMLPLMSLGDNTSTLAVDLLDLPARTLPEWDSLPVLNLTGALTSLGTLALRGALRREQLRACSQEVDKAICTHPIGME